MERPNPVFQMTEAVRLRGTMAVYSSQAEASLGIPQQWREFLLERPELGSSGRLYGASPCSDNGKIHYLAGVAEEGAMRGERVTLEAGEYAVVRVDTPALLRETWVWLLRDWLPESGRRERNAPEFERYTGVSAEGEPIGPVEIWIPLEAGGR